MENKGGKNEALPVVHEQVEHGRFGAVEKIPEDVELPKVEIDEVLGQPAGAPMPPEAPNSAPELSVVKNTLPDIERNAEQIPKAYMKVVEDETNALKKYPYKQQNKVIEFKQDYLEKAFGRTIGKVA